MFDYRETVNIIKTNLFVVMAPIFLTPSFLTLLLFPFLTKLAAHVKCRF